MQAERAQTVHKGHEKRGAVDHGGVDHLAFAALLGFDVGGEHAKGHHHAAAAKISGKVERNDGRSVFGAEDRKSTRLNSSHVATSYAVFCLKKKTRTQYTHRLRDPTV